MMGKISIIFLLMMMLTGCEEKTSYSYLVAHPAALKKAGARCDALTQPTPDEITQCKLVMSIVIQFDGLMREQQSDPERFGQRILETQINYADAEIASQRAQQQLATLRAEGAPEVTVQAAATQVEKAEKRYWQLQDEVALLMTVAAINTPG